MVASDICILLGLSFAQSREIVEDGQSRLIPLMIAERFPLVALDEQRACFA
jgi:hypothetical protein